MTRPSREARKNIASQEAIRRLFLVRHRLRSNPFASGVARPWVASASAKEAARKLDELLGGRIHCLFLSGPNGVGKSSSLRRRVRDGGEAEVCWTAADARTPEAHLIRLLEALGLGTVGGTLSELRNIVGVYLRHQAAHGRQTVVLTDDVEGLPTSVLHELESLANLRLKHRPVVSQVLVTADEALITHSLPRLEAGPHARAAHCRLTGFSLEETQAYVRASLQGCGCESPERLFSPETVIDVQAVTQGVVGNIDALCRTALDLLAARGEPDNARGVTRGLLKEAAAHLDLPYDPTAWTPVEGALSPEAVRRTRPELRIEAARLLVWSGGRQIAEIALDRPRMVIGRDQSCDISLDSSYVSRYQNLLMETADGWMLFDLNSTNGCHVNGRRVREHRLRDGDLIAVGQHQLRFSCPGDAYSGDGRTADETLQSPRPITRRSSG